MEYVQATPPSRPRLSNVPCPLFPDTDIISDEELIRVATAVERSLRDQLNSTSLTFTPPDVSAVDGTLGPSAPSTPNVVVAQLPAILHIVPSPRHVPLHHPANYWLQFSHVQHTLATNYFLYDEVLSIREPSDKQIVLNYVVLSLPEKPSFGQHFFKLEDTLRGIRAVQDVDDDYFNLRDGNQIYAYRSCAPFRPPPGFNWLPLQNVNNIPELTLLIRNDTPFQRDN